jgi:peroxiredoxin
MALLEDLAQFAASMPSRVPAERLAVMERATQDLIASGLAERAARVGDQAPDFALPDASGRIVSLAELRTRGPVLITFYRGGWCPYCNLELRAYQRLLPEIAAEGGTLVAISPQAPDGSLSTAERNALSFPVLSDLDGAAAEAFGLMFELPEELRAVYTTHGNVLPRINGTGDWRLPIPATYVVDQDRRILFAGVEADYRTRPDPADVLAALRGRRRGDHPGSLDAA